MDIQKAREIVETASTDFCQGNKIMRGLHILEKYDKSIHIEPAHDQIYVSNFEETVEQMTEEEVSEMRICGWFEDEDSWSTFT